MARSFNPRVRGRSQGPYPVFPQQSSLYITLVRKMHGDSSLPWLGFMMNPKFQFAGSGRGMNTQGIRNP